MGQKLFIRADATTAIGVGHIMRCIALAQAWQQASGEVTFLSYCESEVLRQQILREGFGLISIDRPHPAPEDLKQAISLLQDSRSDGDNLWFVLDGYHFGPEYQESISEAGSRLIVIDDYNHLPFYHADILVNQNIGAETKKYACEAETVCLLGPRYTLLRTEFLAQKNAIEKRTDRPRNILVTLGGADPDNITLKVVRALLKMELEELKVNLVLGPSNPNTEVLEREIQEVRKSGHTPMEAMRLVRQGNMPELMAKADVAISAGGSTCWELCFLGKPFLVIIAAENQRDIALGLDQAGVATCLGWHHEITERQIHDHLKSLINDTSLRREMSTKGQALVDGKGRLRVLQTLADNCR
jgi:UDP-2,4-diacetamido-2,4,6-trideoxy-beta-L-altropyranose hydrolase